MVDQEHLRRHNMFKGFLYISLIQGKIYEDLMAICLQIQQMMIWHSIVKMRTTSYYAYHHPKMCSSMLESELGQLLSEILNEKKKPLEVWIEMERVDRKKRLSRSVLSVSLWATIMKKWKLSKEIPWSTKKIHKMQQKYYRLAVRRGRGCRTRGSRGETNLLTA